MRLIHTRHLFNLLLSHSSFLLHLLSTPCDKYPNHANTSFQLPPHSNNSNILFFSFLKSLCFLLLSFPTSLLSHEAHSLASTIHFCFGVNHHHCIRSWSSSRPLCRWPCLRCYFSSSTVHKSKDANFHAYLHFPT